MADRVTPRVAHALMTSEGFEYLDVRTVAEFDAGHPLGAYNLPLLVDGPRGRVANESFVRVALTAFPRDRRLVVGCLAATRSAKAAELLEGAGYESVRVQSAGWGGATDAFGRVKEPGWKAAGLPIATRAEPGRSWAELTGVLDPEDPDGSGRSPRTVGAGAVEPTQRGTDLELEKFR